MTRRSTTQVLTEAVKNGRNGGREQSIALGALRNLAADPDTKLRITRHSGEVIIAVCWAVDDLQCKARALGILGNVCAEEACGNFLVDKGLVEVAMLTLKDTVDGGMDLNGTEQEEQQASTLPASSHQTMSVADVQHLCRSGRWP